LTSARAASLFSFSSPKTMIVAALALRLLVMAFTYTAQLDPALDHKAFGYETGRVARSIATGRGFSSPYGEPTGPTALIPPAYTFLLAGVFKLFGVYTKASALAILSLNNLFSSLTCLPVFLIARRVFGARAAVGAGWMWALFPYSITLSNITIWETTLTTLLLTLLVLATLSLEQSSTFGGWIGYGLLWALAALSSPTTLIALPFLGLWIWWRQLRRGNNCTAAAFAASLVFLAAVAPWVWRCSRVYGRFVPFRSGFGLDFLVGNSDDTRTPSNWNVLPADNPAEFQIFRTLGEPTYMASKQREAVDFIFRETGRFVRQTLRRILFTWTAIWDFPPGWNLGDSGLPNVLTYTLFSALALAGIAGAIRDGRDSVIPLLIPLLLFPLVYYVTHADIRFRHPVDPEVVIFAAYGATAFFSGKSGKLAAASNS
jgi:4-amino-4-deoxy-L-arabinose transferase-like glycosyltransferase